MLLWAYLCYCGYVSRESINYWTNLDIFITLSQIHNVIDTYLLALWGQIVDRCGRIFRGLLWLPQYVSTMQNTPKYGYCEKPQ